MSLSKILKAGLGSNLNDASIQDVILDEQSRIDYDIFMKRVKEYMSRNQIDLNSIRLNEDDMREAYNNGEYPSEFVRKYVKSRK